jgi:uncharacterized protein (UPF0335 family)
MSDGTGNLAREHLRAFIERIERLEEEKATLLEDIREVYAEAKGTGFDPKIMRQVVRIRKLSWIPISLPLVCSSSLAPMMQALKIQRQKTYSTPPQNNSLE